LIPGSELPELEQIEAFVRTLPPAANAAETALLKAKLLEIAFRWSLFTHERSHGGGRGSCLFSTLEPLADSWRVDPRWDDEVAH
jgi:hypothetical protein